MRIRTAMSRNKHEAAGTRDDSIFRPVRKTFGSELAHEEAGTFSCVREWLKVSLREQARSHGIVGCLDISASSEYLWEPSRRYAPRCRAANRVHDSSPVVMRIP